MRNRWFVVCCAVAWGVGGASAAQGQNRPSSSRDILSREEILERAPGAISVQQAIQRLRSTWLRLAGFTSTNDATATPIKVYVNNVPVGDHNVLETYPVDRVAEIFHFDATEATQRWGTGHTRGAIEIIETGSAPRTAEREPPRPGENANPDADDPTVAFRPFIPFNVKPVIMLWSGASILADPFEVRNVWEPAISLGAGLGLNVTRNTTVFAAVEYHTFRFSENGTIRYFMSHTQFPLRSPDGVTVSGSSSSIFNVTGNVKFHPRFGLIRPYLTGTAGYGRFHAGQFVLTGADGNPIPRRQFVLQEAAGGAQDENSFAVGAGFGFDFKVTESLRFMADTRFVTLIRGPRYKDAYGKNQLHNTGFYPFRFGLLIN